MDTKLLRYFQQVCREQSFTAAAHSLYLSVPGLVKAMDRLEEQMGTKLLVRSHNGVVPTAAGAMLNRHADSLLCQYEYIAGEVLKAGERREMELDICVSIGMLSYFSADFLSGFIAQQPDACMMIHSYPLEQCLDALLTHRKSICLFCGQMDTTSLDIRFHREAPLYVLMSENHPCAKLEVLTLHDLSRERICINNTDPDVTGDLIERLSIAGCSPRIILDSAEWSQSLQLVRKSGYMTFCLPPRKHFDGIAARPVNDLGVHVRFNLATLRGVTLSGMEEAFVKYVISLMQRGSQKGSWGC